MGRDSGISWTDHTWNPVVGCQKVSEGCRNCYANELHDKRFEAYHAGKKVPEQYAVPFTTIQFIEKRVLDPLRWTRKSRIFTNSVSDLFHKDVTDEQLDLIFAVMVRAHELHGHVFQVLTKRPERMQAYLWNASWVENGDRLLNDLIDKQNAGQQRKALKGRPSILEQYAETRRAQGVWLGVSVENQRTADQRIPLLLNTPAVVRFLSCEPLLGAVDLTPFLGAVMEVKDGDKVSRVLPPGCRDVIELAKKIRNGTTNLRLNPMFDSELHWVIVGGESGNNARPMHPDWVRTMRDQCLEHHVPFFFKQWGEFIEKAQAPLSSHEIADITRSDHPEAYGALQKDGTFHALYSPFSDEARMLRVGVRKAGDVFDGVQHHAFPWGHE